MRKRLIVVAVVIVVGLAVAAVLALRSLDRQMGALHTTIQSLTRMLTVDTAHVRRPIPVLMGSELVAHVTTIRTMSLGVDGLRLFRQYAGTWVREHRVATASRFAAVMDSNEVGAVRFHLVTSPGQDSVLAGAYLILEPGSVLIPIVSLATRLPIR